MRGTRPVASRATALDETDDAKADRARGERCLGKVELGMSEAHALGAIAQQSRSRKLCSLDSSISRSHSFKILACVTSESAAFCSQSD